MKLINLKCPNCGSKLQVNNDLKQFTCTYCGITTLLDDEKIVVEHKVINDDKERIFHNIEIYLENEDYNKVKKYLYKIEEEYPDDSRVYKTYIKYLTLNFTKDIADFNYNQLDEIERNYKKYVKYLDVDDEHFEKEYKKYMDNINYDKEEWETKKKQQDEKDRLYAIITLAIIIFTIIILLF